MSVTDYDIEEMLKARRAALAAKAAKEEKERRAALTPAERASDDAKDEAGWRYGSSALSHSAPGPFGATVRRDPAREAEARRRADEWEERNAGPIALKKAQSAQAGRNRRENWKRHVEQQATDAKQKEEARRTALTPAEKKKEDASAEALWRAMESMKGGERRKSKRRKSKRRKSKRRKSKKRRTSRRN